MINLIEPTRGVNLVQSRHKIMINSSGLSYRIPILADIFVFSYPVYLLALYGYGWFKKELYPKISALMIGFNVAVTVGVNIGIQFLVEKQRPNIVLGFVDEKTETILHKFLPTSSFPSDHAAVSMSIAIASICWGVLYKDQKYIRFGIIGIIFSIIMCGARITNGIHRPTDIIGGMTVGIVVPILLSIPQLHKKLKKMMTRIAEKI